MDQEREELIGAVDDKLREVTQRLLARQAPPEGTDLTFAQGNCMRTIGDLGTPMMSELSAALALHPSTVTGLIDRLLDHGLIERTSDPGDRRIVRVRLSEKGRQGRDEFHRAVRRRFGELVVDLTVDELRSIRASLGLLHAAMMRRGEPEDRGDAKP